MTMAEQKRMRQGRNNAGRFVEPGRGATARGRALRTPSGKARPMQTARMQRATAPGTVTRSGASRAPVSPARGAAMAAQGMSRGLSRLALPLAVAAEILRPTATAKAELTPEMKQKYYSEAKGRRQLEIRDQQVRMDNGSFDDAFASARKQGRSEFSWRGRRYTTEMAGE